jgi:hypothetical protein
MLERTLPVPQIALGEDLSTREPSSARELVRELWARVRRLLRALLDFFAGGGPLS